MYPRRPAASPVRLTALALLLAGLSSPDSAAASPSCQGVGSAVLTAREGCRFGLPAQIGTHLLVPKVCLIPMGKEAVIRHAVEIREAATGRRVGQASLPAQKAALTATLPALGTLLAGEIPLYVWEGGIGAINPASKRAVPVFEPTGRLAAVALHGQVLAVVDALPADAVFPAGSLEWTVLDFGSSTLLGQARLAGTGIDAIGYEAQGSALTATLGRLKGGKLQVLRAPIHGADGKVAVANGLLKPALSQGAAPTASAPKAAPGCPVLPARTSAIVGKAALVVQGKAVTLHPEEGRTNARLTGGPAGCAVSTVPDSAGAAWAWVGGDKEAALHKLRCK